MVGKTAKQIRLEVNATLEMGGFGTGGVLEVERG